jgi:formylglycine-generating enzyme required for sulfatase activity
VKVLSVSLFASLVTLSFCLPVSAQVSTPERDIAEEFGMEFVSIPAGSFNMGSPASEANRGSDEDPLHPVTVPAFEMMTTEVTQGMWVEVMGNNPAYFTDELNRPVETVDWNDCHEFVDVMNNLDPSYTYRLPSEAEWEYACRAGANERDCWGDDPSFSLIDEYAWYWTNSDETTHPVGQKLPNAWGLYDMSGNVWEWCEDWYHSNYEGAPSNGSPWLEPEGFYRVSRGGSWICGALCCRPACRVYSAPDLTCYDLGFRLARSER